MVTTRSSSRVPDSPSSTATMTLSPSKSTPTRRTNKPTTFLHTPTTLTLAWLAISLPLVIWDTGYVLLRPHSMPGGALHWPLWVPYKLYGEVDFVYGWKALEVKSGFTSAQGFLNAIETSMYFVYLYVWYVKGTSGGGVQRKSVGGREAAWGVLIGFSAAVMTLSKTVLYWAHEYYSEFGNISHNSPIDLLFLWIIPNGAWLVGSSYLIWALGGDILSAIAGPPRVKKA